MQRALDDGGLLLAEVVRNQGVELVRRRQELTLRRLLLQNRGRSGERLLSRRDKTDCFVQQRANEVFPSRETTGNLWD